MRAVPHKAGRRRAITLRDVPIDIRRRHAAHLIARATLDADLSAAVALKRAAENPSGKVYLVDAAAAAAAVLGDP